MEEIKKPGFVIFIFLDLSKDTHTDLLKQYESKNYLRKYLLFLNSGYEQILALAFHWQN
jgi:hypothetical protein